MRSTGHQEIANSQGNIDHTEADHPSSLVLGYTDNCTVRQISFVARGLQGHQHNPEGPSGSTVATLSVIHNPEHCA
jgi:hypothetical protein